MTTLYRVDCGACEFSCCTNSGHEARKIAQFHYNWATDTHGPLHQTRITASAYATLPATQTILDAVAVLA